MRNASAAKKEGNGIKKRKSKQERRFFLLGLLFVSPWLIGFLCFQLYPILSALYYSFTDFNIFQPAEFTGLDNYVTLFNDKYFPVSIKNTAVMSFIGMPIGLVVALALAVLLSKEVKGMPAFRTIYYLPTVVPIVASAMLFLWVLNPEYGLLNNFLSWFGIRGPSWLSDPKFTKISLMIMDVWRCGQNTVIFLSALKAVPKSFYEAAELDGAGPVKRFFKITLPYISPHHSVPGIGDGAYFRPFSISRRRMCLPVCFPGGAEHHRRAAELAFVLFDVSVYERLQLHEDGYASAMAIVLFLDCAGGFVRGHVPDGKRVTHDVK